jgi:hypothetical protein
MSATETEIFHEFFGPYENTRFALFKDLGDTYRLSFDAGPEFNVAAIFADDVTAFKFQANTIIELRVTVLYGRKLQFHGTQIPTFSTFNLTAMAETEDDEEITDYCGSIHCSESIPCPDPSKPIMVCELGIPKCSRGEQ